MGRVYKIDKRLLDITKGTNININEVLMECGIKQDYSLSDYLSVSRESYIQLMKTLSDVIDEETFLSSFDISRRLSIIPPVYAALCSRNGYDGFLRIEKYKELCGPFTLEFVDEKDTVKLKFYFDDKKQILPKLSVMMEAAIMKQVISEGTGLDIKPVRMISTYDMATFEKEMGVPVTLGMENSITFKKSDTLIPFITASSLTLELLESGLKDDLENVESDSLLKALQDSLLALVPAGRGNVEEVAKSLALSPRTLQRKLSQRSTSFSKELDKIRETLAKKYISENHITNEDIAYLIGYSDATAFSRAFHKWTGISTVEYRKQII